MKDTKQQWFKDAKYGLFIHWGLYSILAGEYNGQKTDSIAEWILSDLDIPLDEYIRLADEFNPTEFDAEEYVKLAKGFGMKYLTLTSKHHDGFALFDSKVCDFNTVKATPFGRDVVKEFADACKKHDMPFCLYYSQAQDWHHSDGYRSYPDDRKDSGKDFRRYLDEKCIPQIKELLTNYGDIAMVWFDTPMIMTKEQSKELYDLVKSIQPNCIINGRIGNNIGDYITATDNKIPAFTLQSDWEVPVTLNDTWGYSKYDNNWKSPEHLIKLMLKINSRGGNMLLNIGPKADGSTPQKSTDILNNVAKYLNVNSEAVFGTLPTPPYIYDLDNITMTSKPNRLYLHLLEPTEVIYLNNLANEVTAVSLLGRDDKVKYTADNSLEGDSMLKILLSENQFSTETGLVVKIEYKEPQPIYEPLE